MDPKKSQQTKKKWFHQQALEVALRFEEDISPLIFSERFTLTQRSDWKKQQGTTKFHRGLVDWYLANCSTGRLEHHRPLDRRAAEGPQEDRVFLMSTFL